MRRRVPIYRSPGDRREPEPGRAVCGERVPCSHIELGLGQERIKVSVRDLLAERLALFDDSVDLAFARLLVDHFPQG